LSVALAAFLTYTGRTPLGGIFGFNGFQCLKFDQRKFPEKQIDVMQRTPLLLYNDIDNLTTPIKNV